MRLGFALTLLIKQPRSKLKLDFLTFSRESPESASQQGEVEFCGAHDEIVVNGTPRQPLLVPLARAHLLFDPARVPPASLEGLGEYSHCWIIYVFHMNTDLEKLWKHPSKSKFKAKVRVPRLKGQRIGVFATRSPHRPCPIGLTVAKEMDYEAKELFGQIYGKMGEVEIFMDYDPMLLVQSFEIFIPIPNNVEAVEDHMILISGVDLVDGTPVLDVKPYLPYCDSIQRAIVPKWVKEDSALAVVSVNFSESFSVTLSDCWTKLEKKSLYASPDEFQSLIKQVLSWDIRSISQRSRPHYSLVETENGVRVSDNTLDLDDYQNQVTSDNGGEGNSLPFIYHLILEGLDVSYRMDSDGNVLVEKVAPPSHFPNSCENTAIS
ncbi:hypothetical protein U1Q18_018356 [Sarracenia purpurea var. burkii]